MNIHSRRARVLAAVLMAWSACAAAQQSQAGPGAASAAPPITLQQTIALALERHPLLRAAGHEVAAGAADVEQAGRLPNPELAWLREGQQAGDRTTTVQINQPIELGGKRSARIALAEGGLDLANIELALRRQAIRADAIDAYFGVLAAEERRRLADLGAALAARSSSVASSRVAAGKVAPLEAARARLAQAEARAEGERAGADLASARAALAALIGADKATQALAPSGADALPEAEALDALLRRGAEAAEVRRAQARLALRRAQAGVERAARIPDLTLSVGSQRDDQVGRRQAVLGIAVPCRCSTATAAVSPPRANAHRRPRPSWRRHGWRPAARWLRRMRVTCRRAARRSCSNARSRPRRARSTN
jgi:cobalt-zinc-cadmium efflux system outer membrane protein